MKILLIAILMGANIAQAQYVNPYMKRDGTYVEGHQRSRPDNTIYNNYGYKPPGGYEENTVLKRIQGTNPNSVLNKGDNYDYGY